MTIGILMLAAGSSRRFGSDKRRARMDGGQTLLQASLEPALESGFPVTVCVASSDHALAAEIEHTGAAVVLCSRSHEGMGATLAEGVAAVTAWQGVLVALADMPRVKPESFRCVADALSPESIVVPRYREQRGHPVGFGRAFYPPMTALSGDQGARTLLRTYASRVGTVELDDAGVLLDVDTPAALASSEG